MEIKLEDSLLEMKKIYHEGILFTSEGQYVGLLDEWKLHPNSRIVCLNSFPRIKDTLTLYMFNVEVFP